MATQAQGIMGLFAPTMSQEQLDEQKALQFAQLTPAQQSAVLVGRGAAGLGRAIGGMFGVDIQDPQLKRANKLRQLATQFDINTPEGLRQMASAVQQEDPQASMELARMAQAMDLEQAKLGSEKALTAQRMRERQAADPFEKILASGKYTPESLAKYKESGNVADLVLNEKSKSFGTDAERIAKAMFGTDYEKLTPQQADAVNKNMLQQDLLVKATGAPKVSVSTQQETAFAKQRGELQAKSLSEAEAQAKASANAVNRLANMEKLNQGTMLTGPLAGSAIGAGQFLSSLGLLSPDSARTLSNSEVYDKQAKDLVMQDIGGKLGAQISNADREFIEARIPQLRNSQQARTELIAKLKEIHKKNINYYQRMSKYANDKGNLNDFDFASNAPDVTEAPVKQTPTKRFNPATGKIEMIGG